METDISDYDGDSQMASSPESSNAGSRTPVTNPSNARAAELSPPGSHQTQKTAGVSGGKGALFGGVGMDRNAAQQQQQQRQQKQQQQKGKSGDGRLNRRAEEEYQRVMEYVVDKDFSLNRFRFTPVKRASSTIPRLWDRKPSTSFLGRSSRSRKVWKRFRTSFNSMKAFQQMMAAADKQVEEDELDTEINASRSIGLLRGVKRRCLRAGTEDGGGDRGRSFLETKWESEMGRRRRKLPINDACLDQMSGGHETGQQPATSVDVQDSDESVDIEMDSSTTCPQDTVFPGVLHGASSEKFEGDSDIKPLDDHDSTCHATSNTITEEKVSDATDAAAETTIPMDNQQSETEKDTAPAEEIDSAEQESTLVRSALRSSLDGEDAELLNNFLSKAKAKREVKAAMVPREDVEEGTVTIQEGAVPDHPTPRSRRVLEELDANSPNPSPQKVQAASPCKADEPSGSPLRKETTKKDRKQTGNDQQQSGSPTTRRSTRARTPRNPPRTTTTIPLSLRRAKGTEFVFLQRTEAQELALVTRKNTRQNKGDSVLPKYALKALARKQDSNEGPLRPDGSSTSAYKKGDARKTVCWNDVRLVEFEDGEEPQSAPSSPKPSDGSSLDGGNGNMQQSTSKGSEKEKRKTIGKSHNTRSQASVPSIATPPPAARRMRRVENNSSSITTKPSSLSSPLKDATTTTPDKKRKKLTPKSPSTALLGTPHSRKSVTNTTTTTTTTTSKLPKASGSASTSKISSTGAKSKSIFKANAGSTPMPKRVRSRS